MVDWDCATVKVNDATFKPLIARFDGPMIVLTDTAFDARRGDPFNMKVCVLGVWNVRMAVETVHSMLISIRHVNRVTHRVRDYFPAHLALVMAAVTLLVQWHGLQPDEHSLIHLSVAQFSRRS
ncbi:MAG TPA: hypothetical protein VNM72_01370 [Blastocatellia bacterium]|nr:hypothetical protein [Blastocatellia bacterium]